MSLYSRLDRRLEQQADNAGPVRGTLSLLRIGMIWLAANLVVTTLLTGTLFVPGVDFGTAFTMIVFGTLAGAIVLAAVGIDALAARAHQGPRAEGLGMGPRRAGAV